MLRAFAMAAVAALMSACAPSALLFAEDPADPAVAVPAQRYVPVLAGSRTYKPVPPKPWAETNKGVAPKQEDAK